MQDSRDEDSLTSAKTKVDKERAELNEKIQSVLTALKVEDQSAAEKVSMTSL